ncbi:MAG: transglycosylase SLT domain-containing protein [Buchnera aphidicola (Schlechtendalia peitan)]
MKKTSKKYNVDQKLIKSIICIESSGDEKATSNSKAIGLMQIKPFSAGKEVYRFQGKRGHPSVNDLYNPNINIDIGTAYIHILQNQDLSGIYNTEILRYATIVSYVNGSNALLKTLSDNRKIAIKKLNKMKKKEFFNHIKKKHPALQAWKYLKKVMIIYYLI